MSDAPVYDLAGLRVRTTLPLPQVREGPIGHGVDVAADVEVTVREAKRVPDEVPRGCVLAEHADDGQRWHVVVDDGAGYLLRIPRIADFWVSYDTHVVECRPDPGADPAFLPILLGGRLLSLLLTLRGVCVLHGSAVEFDGAAVTVAGPSGTGKSTVAAMLCSAGGRLVTDDVARLGVDGAVTVVRGPGEIRLRRKAAQLLELFDEAPAPRVTADGRLAIAPGRASRSEVPLAAVLIPVPSRTSTDVTDRRLVGPDALLAILGVPAIVGWCDPALTRRFFEEASELATRVPIHQVRIPWGPTFRRETAEALKVVSQEASRRSTSACGRAEAGVDRTPPPPGR